GCRSAEPPGGLRGQAGGGRASRSSPAPPHGRSSLALFLGYLLGKNIGGEIALISFRLTWDGCSSLLPFGGVLSFQSVAREASGSETARLHHAARRRGRWRRVRRRACGV